MPESPLLTLRRWEDHGAIWRTRSTADGEAVIDLCACHGELVDQLRSRDPELLAYLAKRPSSDCEPLMAPAPEGDQPQA
ncbi:MAG: hypothetical protein H0X42_04510 [Solirubrobacterales bacterium]|nr:hypothetical protein [Solirubrobacterales bacterium]